MIKQLNTKKQRTPCIELRHEKTILQRPDQTQTGLPTTRASYGLEILDIETKKIIHMYYPGSKQQNNVLASAAYLSFLG